MIYSWDIKSWLQRNIGTRKRQPIVKAYLYIFLKPIELVHGLFITLSADIDNKVKYTSQQLVLAGLLNKLFDATSKRIRVETVSDAWVHPTIYLRYEGAQPVYIYYRSESADTTHVRYRSEASLDGLFKVFLPTSLTSSEAEIRGWIDQYKEASKTYVIVYI